MTLKRRRKEKLFFARFLCIDDNNHRWARVKSRNGRVSNLFYYPGFEPFDKQ